jgi:hypothetical protein
VNGGTLFSQVSSFNSPLNMPINVTGGTIDVVNNNGLGTGKITFGDGAANAKYVIEDIELGQAFPPTPLVSLANPLELDGGTLGVLGNIQFTGSTTLMSPISTVNVTSGFGLALSGGIDGYKSKDLPILVESNSFGILDLGGTLNLAVVVVPSASSVLLQTSFTITGGLVETIHDKILYS